MCSQLDIKITSQVLEEVVVFENRIKFAFSKIKSVFTLSRKLAYSIHSEIF